MGLLSAVSLFASSLALAPATAGLPTPDATQTARAFLEAFATHPSSTKALVTTDAMIALGDIGGPYLEFLSDIRPKAKWLETCRVTSIQTKPLPPEAELNSEDTPPWLRGGTITILEGAYSCTGPTGSSTDVRVSVALKNGRVAQFYMGATE